MRPSVLKSGKPWAKFTARSAPFSSRFSRVISRMTDSVKLCAFSESRSCEVFSVPGIGALQGEISARARIATVRFLQAALPPAAHLAGPSRLGKEVEHVRAAQEADHLATPDDRDASYPLPDEKSGGLVDPRLLGDRDHTLAHDVTRHFAFLRKHVGLGDDSDHVTFTGHAGRAGDPPRDQRAGDLIYRRVLSKRDHVPI